MEKEGFEPKPSQLEVHHAVHQDGQSRSFGSVIS